MSKEFTVSNYLSKHQNILEKIDIESIQIGIDQIISTFEKEKKIITCGNGGSTAASHCV